MDFPLHHDESVVKPWRTAALVAVAVAAAELLLLVVVGGALLAKPESRGAAAATKKAAAAHRAAASKPKPGPVPVAELVRHKVSVLVLNGNGRQGAAASAASRVLRRGYRVGAVANAPRSDYTRSLVMYRRGFEGEGHRLARDLGVKIVGPLDGLRAAQLHGAQAVLVVGS